MLSKHPGICYHASKLEEPQTVNSFIADVKNREIWIANGNPCNTEFEKFILGY